jgi:hypothetical protein
LRAALTQAALLAAIEKALVTGDVEAVDQPSPTATLRLLPGGGSSSGSAPRPRLTVVG